MKTALYFDQLQDNTVHCQLCPTRCKIEKGEMGECKVRKNIDGTLISENYGLLTAMHVDPIEKKPLYHFHPGSYILSVGSFGCNMHCRHCQNSAISQFGHDHYSNLHQTKPSSILEVALLNEHNIGVAFTYNEPTIYYEYMLETAIESHKFGLKNVMVTNGYINKAPLKELIPHMDAFNVDLKAFTEKFYREIAYAHIKPIKENLKLIRAAGKHLEITFLLIPGINDDKKEFLEMLKWITNELGEDTILHISRYFPSYRLHLPKTTKSKMYEFCHRASQHLNYVYMGNVAGNEFQHTYCKKCKRKVISRFGYMIQHHGIDEKGNCMSCGEKIVIK